MDTPRRALSCRHPTQSIRQRRAGARGVEPLERRAMLSAAIGAQPTGALTGKIIFTSGGHGYTAATDGSWSTGRPLSNGMVEDMGNQDQMTALANYAFNAGATIVPMRPVGHQENEVVIDNGSATFTGTWSAGTSNPYFSLNSGNDAARYMSATGSATETATARYTPNIPQAGFYPVYGWSLNGTNRLPDQTYRITFAGGKTEVKVNHQRVGKGWIYLGTYYFNAGTSGFVEISNKTSAANPSSVVAIADAIRFGNGMGDIDRGAGVSGHNREDEQSLYWIQAQAGFTAPGTPVPASTYRGTLTLDSDANVGAPPRWARWMNDSTVGPMTDRLFLSFHSNAAGGGISNTRGTLGLYNGNSDPTTATPNQQAWATLMGSEVTNELVALGTRLEYPWANNSIVTLDRSDIEFGEINDHSISGEFDATICEVGYHDNTMDAADLLDPDVRQWIARASVHAMTKYFNQFGGGALNFQPDAPTDLRATTDAAGNVTLHWLAPVADGAGAGSPTGYMVYQSANGYGFDGGTLVSGGGTLQFTISAASLAGGSGATFFRVTAINAGGQSLPAASEVIAARRQLTASGGITAPILIVNGFDRMDRASDARQTAVITAGSAAVTFNRVRDRYNNTRDYTVQAANAIAAFGGASLGFDSCQNDDIRSGAVNLGGYKAVIWLSGEQSTADHTFTIAEQTAVANYITNGGRLFVSGSEIGWDLAAQGNGASFFNNTLHAAYVADDANTYAASGAAGSIFSGVSLGFDNGTAGTYDVDFPDVLNVSAGSSVAMNYTGGTAGAAAVQWASGTNTARVVTSGFPFETITTAANRNAMMAAVLNYFALTSASPAAPDLVAAKDTGISSSDNLTRLNNAAPGTALQFTVSGTVAGSIVTIYADSVAIGSATASGTTTTVTTDGSTDLSDGAHTITATQAQTGKIESPLSSSLIVIIDTAAPQVSSLVFRYLTGHSVQVQFSESVSATFANSDLSLTNVTTSSTVPSSAMSVSNNGNGLETITFPGASSNGVLADGNYSLSIMPTNVTDGAGNPLSSASTTLSFFVLSADANHDRAVDTLDFNALAGNFGQTGRNYSQGDFNYDAVTDTLDFNALAAHFGQSLAPPVEASVSATSIAAARTPSAMKPLFSDQPLDREIALVQQILSA